MNLGNALLTIQFRITYFCHAFLQTKGQGCTNFPEFRSHLKILGTRRVACSQFIPGTHKY